MADSVLQEIKDRLNIAEVIGGYIQVKKAGSAFKALCPFHHEKTPSMQISPQKQIWHCFGCGEGGDVISFVQKYENLEFKEALRLLADRAGVQLPEFRPRNPEAENEKDTLFRINDFAARFYHQVLVSDLRGKDALKYLLERGLSLETINKWQVGFAPDDFHALEQALASKQVRQADMVKAGVSTKNERGQVYDRFRGRITFPIFDLSNRCLGFSARILKDDGKSAKYVNSPETIIYNKSRVLFGLNFAKNVARQKEEIVVVEGQMDCISAHQAGIANVVASSGTALTESQLDLLSRFTRHLKFCFDADAAGLKATRRAIEMYLGKDFVVKIVDLKGAKDPDELLKAGPDKFLSLVAQAPLFMDYYLAKAFENYQEKSVEQKKEAARDVLPLIKALTDAVEQDHYVRVLAEKLGASEKAVRQSLAAVKSPGQPSPATKIAKKSELHGQVTRNGLEKESFGGILSYPDFARQAREKLNLEDFENPEIRQALEFFFNSAEGFPDKSLSVAKEALFMVESLVENAQGNHEAVEKQLFKSLAMLKVTVIKQLLGKLQQDLKFAENAVDKPQIAKIQEQILLLTNSRMEFESNF